MSASAYTDHSKSHINTHTHKHTHTKLYRKFVDDFLPNTKNFSTLTSPGTDTSTPSTKSADATSTFGTAGARMHRCQKVQYKTKQKFTQTLGKIIDLWSSQRDFGHFFHIKHRLHQLATLSNRTQ